MQTSEIELLPYGDAALLITSSIPDRERWWRQMQRFGRCLGGLESQGVTDVVATYDSLFIEFDNLVIRHDEVRELVAARLLALSDDRPLDGRRFTIPVVYGGDSGPDLGDVARLLQTPEREVVERHTSAEFVVRCRGHGGGPMLTSEEFRASVSRLPRPRPQKPAGSVGLAGRHTTVSAGGGPGGWRLLGRTPLTIMDWRSDPMLGPAPGDVVRFRSISCDEWGLYVGVRATPDDA